jgi:uridine kinase
MTTKKPFIIGITGGSGSGKTLFLKKLLENFNKEEICLISQDNYYYPRGQQPKDENGVSNFDTTQSIDFESYAKDISTLREGKKVLKKEYTFNNPSIKPSMLEFNPAPIIVVEGIFVLYYRDIADLLDLKVFIDAKDHIRLKRRILRDNDERGYDLDDVLYRYERHVIPTYEKYIQPYKQESDLIIPNNSEFSKALSMLVAFLKTKVTD